jgi:ADP-ribose pyrophosphatase YjhB (NUDIX family)
MMTEAAWLRWAKQINAIAQAGLTYSTNEYDLERYHQLMRLAAEIMASGGAIEADAMLAHWYLQDGYATPKVDVRAIVFDAQGRILLVQEKADGCWAPPGGWADPNDAPSQVAEREVREESHIEVHAIRLLALLDRSVQGHEPPFPYHVYKTFILCEYVTGTPSGSEETLDAAWFALDALPPLSEGRILARQLLRMAELAQNPSLPPDMD